MLRNLQNNDTFIALLLGVMFLLVFILQVLQKKPNFWKFFKQEDDEIQNVSLSGGLLLIVYIFLFSNLLASIIKTPPKWLETYQPIGMTIGAWGYIIAVFSIYCILKYVLHFLFFRIIEEPKKFKRLERAAVKFYFVLVLLLILANYLVTYKVSNSPEFLRITLLCCLVIIVFKQFYYLFNKNRLLPKVWYYKILYICALQFSPLLVLWKLLFF